MQVSLERLIRCRDAVAALACEDPVYLPIFIRLEAECELAAATTSPVERARALARALSAA